MYHCPSKARMRPYAWAGCCKSAHFAHAQRHLFAFMGHPLINNRATLISNDFEIFILSVMVKIHLTSSNYKYIGQFGFHAIIQIRRTARNV